MYLNRAMFSKDLLATFTCCVPHKRQENVMSLALIQEPRNVEVINHHSTALRSK